MKADLSDVSEIQTIAIDIDQRGLKREFCAVAKRAFGSARERTDTLNERYSTRESYDQGRADPQRVMLSRITGRQENGGGKPEKAGDYSANAAGHNLSTDCFSVQV